MEKHKFIFFIGYFIYLHLKHWSPSWFHLCKAYSQSPSLCLYEGTPPPIHPLLPHRSNIPLCWGIKPSLDQGPPLILMPDKSIFLYICSWSHGFLHVYILFGWWFSPWEIWVFQLVDTVLPMELQSPSAPSDLPLAIPFGSWLWVSTSVSKVMAEPLRRKPY